jgi:TPP-dependent pyruvate/acetoin dehydrogenase alpha subunit
MNNGIAHESMNFSTMAQLEHGLPVIYFVENNQYGYTGQQKGEVTDIEHLSQRGAGYNKEGMHAEHGHGAGVVGAFRAAGKARGQAYPEREVDEGEVDDSCGPGPETSTTAGVRSDSRLRCTSCQT